MLFCFGGGWGIRTLVPVKANGFQVDGMVSHPVTVCPRKSRKIPDFCPFSCTFLQILCKMQEKCKKKIKTVRVVISLILPKDMKGFKMTKEEKRKALERMLKGAPDVMSARQVSRWSPLGKNHVYELIHKGDLCAFNYRSSYIIAKVDLIDYLLAHSDDPPLRPTGTGGRKKK